MGKQSPLAVHNPGLLQVEAQCPSQAFRGTDTLAGPVSRDQCGFARDRAAAQADSATLENLDIVFSLAYDRTRELYVLIRNEGGGLNEFAVDDGIAKSIVECIETNLNIHSPSHKRRLTTPGFGLSSRELLILQAVAEGMTNRGIALKLHITENTAKRHLQHIFAKMGVLSRTQAVMLALSEGLISIKGHSASR